MDNAVLCHRICYDVKSEWKCEMPVKGELTVVDVQLQDDHSLISHNIKYPLCKLKQEKKK